MITLWSSSTKIAFSCQNHVNFIGSTFLPSLRTRAILQLICMFACHNTGLKSFLKPQDVLIFEY